jgi:hypothetical protein
MTTSPSDHLCNPRSMVVGQRYSALQYGAGGLLVVGITLFTAGDAEGAPNFSGTGVALITVALVGGRAVGWERPGSGTTCLLGLGRNEG